MGQNDGSSLGADRTEARAAYGGAPGQNYFERTMADPPDSNDAAKHRLSSNAGLADPNNALKHSSGMRPAGRDPYFYGGDHRSTPYNVDGELKSGESRTHSESEKTSHVHLSTGNLFLDASLAIVHIFDGGKKDDNNFHTQSKY